jgi:hypothetical protein
MDDVVQNQPKVVGHLVPLDASEVGANVGDCDGDPFTPREAVR